MREKMAAAVELGKRRWLGKSEAERKAHGVAVWRRRKAKTERMRASKSVDPT